MSAFLSILKNDTKIILRDVKALLLLLIMPVLVISVFAVALGPMLEKTSFIEPFSIAVVDQEDSVWTGMLIAQLRNLDMLDNIYRANEDEAKRLIENNEAAAAIVIPENITDSVERWEPEQGKVIGNSQLHLQTQIVKNVAVVGSTSVSAGLAALYAINDYEYRAGVDPEQVYQDIVKANEDFINVVLARKEIFRETRHRGAGVSPAEYYAASLLSVFIMFSSVPCIKMLAQERKLGISARFGSAPAGGWQSIISKLVLSVVISAAQFILIGLFLRLSSKSFGRIPAGPFILVFLFTTIAAAAFSLLIAAIATSAASTDLIANLSILLMAIVGGSVYPLTSLPGLCKDLSALTINRWSTEGFLAILTGDTSGMLPVYCFSLLYLAVLYLAAALLVQRLGRRRPA